MPQNYWFLVPWVSNGISRGRFLDSIVATNSAQPTKSTFYGFVLYVSKRPIKGDDEFPSFTLHTIPKLLLLELWFWILIVRTRFEISIAVLMASERASGLCGHSGGMAELKCSSGRRRGMREKSLLMTFWWGQVREVEDWMRRIGYDGQVKAGTKGDVTTWSVSICTLALRLDESFRS